MTTKQAAVTSAKVSAGQSRDWLRGIALVLIILGLLVAGYLTAVELTGGEPICPGGFEGEATSRSVVVNCSDVQHSVYARLVGIPVAFIGLGGYLAIGLALVLEKRIALLRDYGHLLVFGMALFGFLYSAYLTYVEFFIIYTVCTWCLTSAAIMTGIFVIATIRLVQYLRTPIAE